MKLLFIMMTVLEAGAGIALLILPAWAVSMLLGVPLETPAGLVAARVAGAGIAALAISCWQARNGERGGPATGVVKAMLFYNFAVMAVLVYAGILLELRGALLWSAIVLHFGLGIWCLVNLWFTFRKLSRAETKIMDLRAS